MLYVCIGRASSPQMGVRHDGGASASVSVSAGGSAGGAASSGKKEYYDPVRNG